MAPFAPNEGVSMTPDALSAYRHERQRSRVVGVRDWLAVSLGNLTLRIASPAYRRLVEEAIRRGLRDIAQSRDRNP